MSAAHPSPSPGFRFTGWHLLASVSAFFAVVIAIDVTFTVFAVRTFPGQVSAGAMAARMCAGALRRSCHKTV